MHHILLAHGTAVQAMRASGMQNLGAVCNFEYALPADDSAAAQKAADVYDAIYNRFFLSGLFKGEYPDLVMQGFQDHMPKAGRMILMSSKRRLIGWASITTPASASRPPPSPLSPREKARLWRAIRSGRITKRCRPKAR